MLITSRHWGHKAFEYTATSTYASVHVLADNIRLLVLVFILHERLRSWTLGRKRTAAYPDQPAQFLGAAGNSRLNEFAPKQKLRATRDLMKQRPIMPRNPSGPAPHEANPLPSVRIFTEVTNTARATIIIHCRHRKLQTSGAGAELHRSPAASCSSSLQRLTIRAAARKASTCLPSLAS